MRSIRTFCRLCKKVCITQGHSGEIPRERVESGVLKDMKGKNLGEQEKLRGCSLNPEPSYFKDKETLGLRLVHPLFFLSLKNPAGAKQCDGGLV